LLSSGPNAGLGEINLPQKQAGSSIMPGKVNPVIPEAVAQAAILIMGHDQSITQACSLGNLELNQFMPLIAHSLLESLTLMINAVTILKDHCIIGITANEEHCKKNVENSTATVTALIPKIGYSKAEKIIELVQKENLTVKTAAIKSGYLTEIEFKLLITPEAVCRLGS
ncbi:MAG: aspartate ammonia-lyase, partial [Mariniphaga sp.]|nr:aspartate ammonia-lyase [Mariniphaga sp.]